MKFSDKFKTTWWLLLTAGITILGFVRINEGEFNDFDKYLLATWLILAFFPLVSEISLFGFSVKKEFQAVKDELKTSLLAEIRTQINNQTNVYVETPHPATQKEYAEKIKEENLEEQQSTTRESVKDKAFLIGADLDEKKKSKNTKNQERLNKVLQVEELVHEYFKNLHEDDYEPRMRIVDEKSEKKVVVDGLIRDGTRIKEIVEIKLITPLSFDSFYFVASRIVEKVMALGLRIPVRFVVVSEEMDKKGATIITNQILKLNFTRHLNPSLPLIDVETFRLEEGALIKIKITDDE